MSPLWIALACVAGVLLLVFWNNRSVWGGTTIGTILGLIVAVVYKFTGSGFSWLVVAKWAIIAAIVSVALEFLDRAVLGKQK